MAIQCLFAYCDRYCGKIEGVTVELSAVFRDPSSISSIPSYEGQPMVDTLYQQVVVASFNIQIYRHFSCTLFVLIVG